MKNTFKRIVCVVLALVLIIPSAGIFAGAAASDGEIQIDLICANVAGLPIPALFSSEHRIVARAQKIFGKMLNESAADIVCVQEDFQYHGTLAKQMTNYPYQTFTSGGIPAGDGLNVFSKYPIYNIERVAWNEYCGTLTNDNDGLTPKGFLKCTVDFDGVLIDVYNIHTDASRTMEDQLAKKAQFIQLEEYIRQNSAGMPVMITGDMNCTLHTYYYAEFYETMIRKGGFEDAWVNVVNNGNYLRGDDAQDIIDSYNAQYNNEFWGLWDS
ncbi:MAG: endonuclease/exonuclease/phosphatase family protein, partial [Clostridia bacterium]|nr:endonuclease/exonuclease/phosphatase family protein [Clostridia bacterium]